MHFLVLGHDRRALAGEGFVFVLLGLDCAVGQKRGVGAGEFFHDGGLFMVGLENAGLVGAELFKLGFEEGVFLAGDCFFVQNEHVGDVVSVDLVVVSELKLLEALNRQQQTFSFKSFKICCLSFLTKFNFLSSSSTA